MINCLLDNPREIDYHGKTKVQTKNSILLEQYTKKAIREVPMKFIPPKSAYNDIETLLERLNVKNNDKLIAICTTSKKKEKDMPLKDCKTLIQALQKEGYTLLLLGAGVVARNYEEELYKIAKDDFINLVDKTTIAQLGALLAHCKALISVDTGTMHLGLAVNVPTVCLFYIHTKAHLDAWAPEKSLYRCDVLTKNIKVENIISSFKKIME